MIFVLIAINDGATFVEQQLKMRKRVVDGSTNCVNFITFVNSEKIKTRDTEEISISTCYYWFWD